MKIRRIPPTDLIKMAACDDESEIRKRLESFGSYPPPFSYRPIRKSLHEILNSTGDLSLSTERVSKEKLKDQIISKCRNKELEINNNVKCALALLEESEKNNWRSRSFSMPKISTPLGGELDYWSDIIVFHQGKAIIPFFDFRSKGGIIEEFEKKMIFSAQRHVVLERDPDLVNVIPAVIGTPKRGENRDVNIFLHNQDELISYEELESRLINVYRIWADVSHEQPTRKRGTGTDDQNGFPF